MKFEIYRDCGRWFFDDATLAITKEEFIAGVPDFIEFLLDDPSQDKIVVDVSVLKPEEYSVVLTKDPFQDTNGVFYDSCGIHMWFCPTFWKYFKKPGPEKIYVTIL